MGIKTNELQQVTSILGTDSLLVDTAAAGTGRITMAQAAEFFGAEQIKPTNPVGAALSNKADAGFGYGEARRQLIVNDDADGTALEAAATAMMHDMPTASSVQIDISNTPMLPANYYIGALNKQGDGSCASIFALSHHGDIVFKTRSYSKWNPWRRVAIAEPPTWYNLPLANGFIASGSPAYNQYCKDQFGRVTVRLKCSTPDNSDIANGAIIATLPEGYRPPTGFTARNHIVYDDIRGKLSYITVDANGTIRGYGYDHSGFGGATTEISFFI